MEMVGTSFNWFYEFFDNVSNIFDECFVTFVTFSVILVEFSTFFQHLKQFLRLFYNFCHISNDFSQFFQLFRPFWQLFRHFCISFNDFYTIFNCFYNILNNFYWNVKLGYFSSFKKFSDDFLNWNFKFCIYTIWNLNYFYFLSKCDISTFHSQIHNNFIYAKTTQFTFYSNSLKTHIRLTPATLRRFVKGTTLSIIVLIN